ncbi:telomere-protecting terminal protein Tpg [Streptomyces sp. NPDC050164]|uniref:telomere-protecting terminal protein Tpg n=1 Tax=Streptomyces sp. NPDC050164 TaxID=3365605 RepID=UPI0037A02535
MAPAEQLGVSTRTVQRYRAGQLTKPQKRLQAALVEETESQWQPQVRAQVKERAATSTGMMVEVTAYFGFTCTGSSDDGRVRTITTPISPTYAAEILRLQEAGATEEDLHPIVDRRSTIADTRAALLSPRSWYSTVADYCRVLKGSRQRLTSTKLEFLGSFQSRRN